MPAGADAPDVQCLSWGVRPVAPPHFLDELFQVQLDLVEAAKQDPPTDDPRELARRVAALLKRHRDAPGPTPSLDVDFVRRWLNRELGQE